MKKEILAEYFKNLFHFFISIIRILTKSKFSVNIKKENGSNIDCVILGNGPSLNDSFNNGLKKFSNNKSIFCVNAFALAKEYEEFQPNYYIFADPGLWNENSREIVKDLRDNIFEAIIKKTKWNITLFFPFEVKNTKIIYLLQSKNKFLNIKYYNKVTVNGFSWFRNVLYKYNLGMPRTQNVLIPTLILSLNLGFKKIYLFGADHSWHENLVLTENNLLCFRDIHFYDEKETINLIPINDNVSPNNVTIHQEFYSLYLTFKIYFQIKEYAKTKNATIINASSKTFIDAFERMNIK
jgi:hypothetical protein